MTDGREGKISTEFIRANMYVFEEERCLGARLTCTKLRPLLTNEGGFMATVMAMVRATDGKERSGAEWSLSHFGEMLDGRDPFSSPGNRHTD